jgi:hypothetical protein
MLGGATGRTGVDEASAADVCLFYLQRGETACGQLIELGAALANGRQAYIVSDDWFSVQHLDQCRRFSSLEAAVAELVAMAAE